MERNVAMGRGQFPNRVKSNQPSGRRLLTLNGTNPLPTAPDLFPSNRLRGGARYGLLFARLLCSACVCRVLCVWICLSGCCVFVRPMFVVKSPLVRF